jgi:YaeC family lipoprotein
VSGGVRVQRRALALGALGLWLGRGALAAPATVRIGTVPGPHAEVLQHVGERLASAPEPLLQLQLRLSDDGRGLNAAVARGELDAACFQDGVSQAREAAQHPRGLLAVAPTLTLPMALYARYITSPTQLRNGDTIALPAEPPLQSRALVLLQNFGLLSLPAGRGLQARLRDVVAVQRHLRLVALPSAQLVPALQRVALAVIGWDAATAAHLQPGRDSLGVEDGRSPYAGVLAVRRADAQAAWLPPLLAAYRSDDTKRFVLERYQGAVRRAW